MLAVAGSIAPPGVIGDDSHRSGALAHVFSAEFAVNRLIADGAAQRRTPLRGVQQAAFALAYIARHQGVYAHKAGKGVVQRHEDLGVWRQFGAHHKLALVVDADSRGCVEDNRAVVALAPVSATKIAGEYGRGAAAAVSCPACGAD